MFEENVAKFAKINPVLAATLPGGGSVVWEGKVVSGEYDVVFLEGVEKALLVHAYSCKVVVIEDDPERMGAFLSMEETGELLEHPRFALEFVGSERDYLRLAWEHVFLRTHCESAFLQRLMVIVHNIASDYRDFGARIVKNVQHNSRQELFDGVGLKGSFAGVPAVVCGAGPTLEKAVPMETALVIACGSAMGLMRDYHMGVALDPEPPSERFLASGVHAAPLVVQNRACHRMVKRAQGKRISMPPNGNFPYEETVFGERGQFDTGWNAGTMGVALAQFLGCNPIYVSGIDGGYVDGKRYAEGIDAEGTTDDLALGREWVQERGALLYRPLSKQWDISGRLQRALLSLPKLESRKGASLLDVEAILENLLDSFGENHRGKQLLYESELLRDPFYESHLEPIWQIWHWIIEREGAYRVNLSEKERVLKKALFFQQVVRSCYE